LRFRTPDEGETVVHDAVRGEVAFPNDSLEDFVLLRGNGAPIFVLANVVDDIEMAITHVVRGEEHLPNTPKQQLLWEALGHQPPTWAHVPVLVNESRKKLSKRRDKVALESYRDEGYLAAAMVNYLMTLGWAPKGDSEIVPWSVIEAEFRLEDVTHSPAFFDLKKLAAFNGDYIRAMPIEDFVAACEPWIPADWDRARFARIAPELQTRSQTLADAPAQVDFLFTDDPPMDEAAWSKAMTQPWSAKLLDAVIESYETAPWDAESLNEQWKSIAEALDVKLRLAQGTVRVPVTGRLVGPPLFESLVELGREETLRRLKIARARLAD
jgi:glutamyl-tRNA synthetase